MTRRRLRSASVHLGTLTALALTLTACNQVGDDDDCDRPSRPRSLATTEPGRLIPTRVDRLQIQYQPKPVATIPDQGGFGTHLASCGG